MKNILSVALAVFATLSAGESEFNVPDVRAPQVFSERVLSSERVSFSVYDSTKNELSKPITIQDRSWIEQFSKILAVAVYEPHEHIFAFSVAPISFFAKGGITILRIEMLLGGIIRLDSKDYRVGAKTCAAIEQLLKKKEANSSLHPTALSGRGSS